MNKNEEGADMKIIDLLQNEKLSLSFEVFPPKTETAFESVKYATQEIAEKLGMSLSGVKQALLTITDKTGVGRDQFAAYL